MTTIRLLIAPFLPWLEKPFCQPSSRPAVRPRLRHLGPRQVGDVDAERVLLDHVRRPRPAHLDAQVSLPGRLAQGAGDGRLLALRPLPPPDRASWHGQDRVDLDRARETLAEQARV